MFNTLSKNSLFYVLDKNNKPTIKVGKVIDVKINPQSYGLANQEIDITVDANGSTYDFKKIPANMSILSPASGVVISDNAEDMTKEIESMCKYSSQVVDSYDYHKGVVESRDELLAVVNPKYAKEREQEKKIGELETKMSNIETNLGDMKTMLMQLVKQKQV